MLAEERRALLSHALLGVEEATAEVTQDVVVDGATSCPLLVGLTRVLLTLALQLRLLDSIKGASGVLADKLGYFAVLNDVQGRVDHSWEHAG